MILDIVVALIIFKAIACLLDEVADWWLDR